MPAETRGAALPALTGGAQQVLKAEPRGCSAPGSVLLLGEYAVLWPGGLGVAVAVEPRVQVRMRAARALRIEGTDGIDRFAWPARAGGPRAGGPDAGGSGAPGLLDAVVGACARTLGRAPDPALVTVDSGALTGGGRKLGLGSSAAVAVAVTHALLGGPCGATPLDTVFRTALRAHRAAQGGRGSGYDVAASTYGGAGVFHGGGEPRFERVTGRAAPPAGLFLILGDRPLATTPAVAGYLQWARRWPAECARHRRLSDAIVRRAVRTGRWAEAFRAGRLATRWLGKAIGVPVEPAGLHDRLEDAAAAGHAGKPSGAGGELAVCVPAAGAPAPDAPWARPLAVSAAGVSGGIGAAAGRTTP